MITTVSITDLKQNSAQIIKKLQQEGKSVVILQRSHAAAVLVDPDYYAILEEALETANDIKAIEERKNEPTVSFGEVAKKLNRE
ncbi:type II toxin-antitoxin system Phd/YefM family antitoxin [Candidatus Roizmanbacteria bacterium]|nr:type II toxin-antitoxin system Phd/YefM family antitoxin [Candidatus Roizmanbacteria bacterium]